MQTLREIYIAAAHSRIIQLVIIAVVIDTAFGILRAIKDRNFNSCFGINGAIRKIGMIIRITILMLLRSRQMLIHLITKRLITTLTQINTMVLR